MKFADDWIQIVDIWCRMWHSASWSTTTVYLYELKNNIFTQWSKFALFGSSREQLQSHSSIPITTKLLLKS